METISGDIISRLLGKPPSSARLSRCQSVLFIQFELIMKIDKMTPY